MTGQTGTQLPVPDKTDEVTCFAALLASLTFVREATRPKACRVTLVLPADLKGRIGGAMNLLGSPPSVRRTARHRIPPATAVRHPCLTPLRGARP